MKLKSSLLLKPKAIRIGIIILSFIVSFATALLFSSVVDAGIQAQATDTFNPYNSKKLIVGVRTAAEEIGDAPRGDSSGGACGVFGKELEKALGSDILVSYVPVQNNYIGGGFKRYDGLRQELIHVECGPNSRPSSSTPDWAQNIRFSEAPFYETGIKLLMSKSVADSLPNVGGTVAKLEGQVNILVSRNTTTRSELERYSGLTITPFDSRGEALDLMEEDETYAYASDALIVKALLNRGVEEIVNEEGETIRAAQLPYRDRGYTIYPANENYLLNGSAGTESYVIAIKEDTVYADDLMAAVEKAIDSDSMQREQQKLKKAETLGIEIPSPTPPSILEEPISTSPQEFPVVDRSIWENISLAWTVAIISMLLFLTLLFSVLYFSRQNSTKRGQASSSSIYSTDPDGRNNFNFNFNASPTTQIGATTLQHGTGNKVQTMTREQAQAIIADQIKPILEDIASSKLTHREQQKRAKEEGKRLEHEHPTLAKRLAAAVEEGMISAIEDSINHPLASFFIDSFIAFQESGK